MQHMPFIESDYVFLLNYKNPRPLAVHAEADRTCSLEGTRLGTAVFQLITFSSPGFQTEI